MFAAYNFGTAPIAPRGMVPIALRAPAWRGSIAFSTIADYLVCIDETMLYI